MSPRYCSTLHEHIWFVVTRLTRHTDADIATRFNQIYPGQNITEARVAHIRATYGADPAWGGIVTNNQVQGQASGAANQAGGNQLIQPRVSPLRHGQNAQASANVDRTQPRNTAIQEPSDDTLTYGSPSRVGGRWYDGTHEGCHYEGKHRHEVNGGVSFDSTAELDAMILRMRAMVSMEEYAAFLERQQPE
ncbi:hypothetical protein GE09DRAFT_1214565 [Coniochaeta sp. 2T2.1]|nr:hypothetical protein GE09DRAFT_1214565 [Coniochaeta sp. 2T2.1]